MCCSMELSMMAWRCLVVFHMNIVHIFCTHTTEYMKDIEVNPSNDVHVDIKQET